MALLGALNCFFFNSASAINEVVKVVWQKEEEEEALQQQPVESYLRSVDIPELWVRIFLEVDYEDYRQARIENKTNSRTKRRPTAVLKLSEVCKVWRDVIYCNDVWKVLAQRRWRKVKPQARIRNGCASMLGDT